MDLSFDFDKTSIMVELAVFGDEFDPEVMTKRLSIFPDRFWKKGDSIRNLKIVRKESSWMLSTGYVESLYLENQLKEIIARLYPKKDEFIALKKELNVDCKIFAVAIIRDNQTPSIYFDSSVIDFIHEIDAEIDIDLYTHTD